MKPSQTKPASGSLHLADGRVSWVPTMASGRLANDTTFSISDVLRSVLIWEDLKTEYEKVKLPAIKIALTGGGRVAKGAMEVLHGMNIRKVTPAAFIEEQV